MDTVYEQHIYSAEFWRVVRKSGVMAVGWRLSGMGTALGNVSV